MKKLQSKDAGKKSKKKKNESSSRIDFELVDDVSGKTCLVEVKSVTMMIDDEKYGRVAVFPDTKSERAQRHVKDLVDVVKGKDAEAALIFLIQRGDCTLFSPCFEKDPEYAELVSQAVEVGVTIVPVVVDLESVDDIPKRVKYSGMVPYKQRS
jgi:sugar fermentation stimulation protein